MEWLQKARNLFFPEQQQQQQQPQRSQQSESHADMKRQRTPDNRAFSKSQSAKQHHQQQKQQATSSSSSSSSTAKVPPGARVVRQVIKQEPVLIETEELGGKHAGFQGLLWYVLNKKQDKHGDIADEFLEEGSKPSQLNRQQQVRPASSLAVKDVDKGNVFLVQTKKAKH